MTQSHLTDYFVHQLLRAHDWQQRPQFNDVCHWWRDGGRGVLALVGMGGAGKTAIAERFLRVLPGGLPADPVVPKDGSLPKPRGVFVFSFYDAPNQEAFFEALQMWLDDSAEVEKVLSLQQLLFKLQRASGLLVLDGLEKVQEDGVRGLLGRLASPKLREFLDRIAAGYLSDLSVLVTSRFPLADLRDARPQFFRLLPVDEIELPAGIQLLRARGVRGTDPQLSDIVNACGRHALTVDFAGGYIAEFGGGDPETRIDFKMDSARLRQQLDDEPDEARRHVLKQGHRFARLAERYRDAMLGGMLDRVDGDAAALALLERICLFRLGVTADTLASIFTGKQAVKVSGPALAGLSVQQLHKKLDWLVRMRIVESQSEFRDLKSEISNSKSQLRYSMHPAVRDGFLSGMGDTALRENHEAVRQGLEVSLGDSPGRNPSDSATLDLLEEIVHHTLQSGYVLEAWDIYQNRIGNYQNLGWRLGAYERGERICREFAGECRLLLRESTPFCVARDETPYHSLPEAAQASFIAEWGLYLSQLGRLDDAARCYDVNLAVETSGEDWKNASITNQNLSAAKLLSGRLTAGQETATEALRLAELTKDTKAQCDAHTNSAQAHALLGEVPAALAAFRFALDWQRTAEGDNDRPLWSLRGIQHTHLLARLGRRNQATQLTEANIAIEINAIGQLSDHIPLCNLILSDLHCEAGDFAQAEVLHSAAHDWAMARDAKEVLCWSALVQARIELAKLQSYSTEENRENGGSSVDLAVPSGSSCSTALRDGIQIARDCGYGLYHVDLLLVRARLHLLRGEPQAALDDLGTALEVGIPSDEQTGQPELLAAMHPECGYAWAIAEGLSLRGEALLLQAAQILGKSTFIPAHRVTLPAGVLDLLTQAESCLSESLARWQPLHDPEPELPDQNFILDGQPYNHRATETYRLLERLSAGQILLPTHISSSVESRDNALQVTAKTHDDKAAARKAKMRDVWNEKMRERLFVAVQAANVRGVLEIFATVLEYWAANLREDIFDYLGDTQYAQEMQAFAGIRGPAWLLDEFIGQVESLELLKIHKGVRFAEDFNAKITGVVDYRHRLVKTLFGYASQNPYALEAMQAFELEAVANEIRGHIFAVVRYIRLIESQLPKIQVDQENKMTRCNVLFLAANPLDCNALELDEEARAIEQRILQTEHRDAIVFVPKFAVRRDDLQLHLNRERPHVLHFSGHGAKDEIEFKGDDGNAAPVSKAGLKAMLKAVKDNIRLVVLNACYTRQQADSITDVIDCAIGMKSGIGDEAARVFAASFYLAIGFGRSVQNAFDQAVAQLAVMGIPEFKTPILSCRTGVDPAYVFLVDRPEKPYQSESKFITAIEFTLDRPLSEFNESKFKAAFQDVTGIDAELIRIASIRPGSTIVSVEGAPEILTQVLNQFRDSQESM